jgi:hypothetical protein
VIRAFHFDRIGAANVGEEMSLVKATPIDTTNGQIDLAMMQHIDDRFPNGLSHFGTDYLIKRLFLPGTEDTDQEIELIFELVRRAEHPDRPSRYTSIFAAESLEAALGWRTEVDASDAPIYEVEAPAAFRGDAEHLTLAGTVADVWMRAGAFWRGDATPAPRWELLLEPPVRVVAAVG